MKLQIKKQLQIALKTEKFIQKAKTVHGDKYDYSKTIFLNPKTKVIIICHKHGEFKQNPYCHLKGTGCPICNESKGESFIASILNKHSVQYTREYKIPNQKYHYEYDFYLPEYNLFIEFHGEQHFRYVPYFHKSKDKFKLQKERDIFKKELAKLANIPLLEFNYLQLNELTKEQFEEIIIKQIHKFKN